MTEEVVEKRLQKLFRNTIEQICNMYGEWGDCRYMDVYFLSGGKPYVQIAFHEKELSESDRKLISLIMDLGTAMLADNVEVAVFVREGFYKVPEEAAGSKEKD